MSVLIPSIALGSLYCLIALTIVFHFHISRYVNIAVLGYVVAAPYLVGWVSGEKPSFAWFFLSCVFVAIFLGLVNWVVDTFVIDPLTHLPATMKVLVSAAVFFIILTGINIAWPTENPLDNPVGPDSFTLLSTKVLYLDAVSIVVAVLLILVVYLFRTHLLIGKQLRAYIDDKDAARTHGISALVMRITVSVITGIFVTVAGVFLTRYPHADVYVPSVFEYSSIALAGVIIARHTNLKIAAISSFVIAFAQTYVSVNIDTEKTLGLVFAHYCVPFVLALIALAVIPRSWVKEDARG